MFGASYKTPAAPRTRSKTMLETSWSSLVEQPVRFVKHASRWAFVFVVFYFVHAYLRHEYHARCSRVLIRVILLQRSDMCVQLGRVLSAIETVCSQDVIKLISVLA